LLTSEEKDNFTNKINSLPSNFSSVEQGNNILKNLDDIERESLIFIKSKKRDNRSVDQKRTDFITKTLEKLSG
jgi:hypothetical protein